MARIDDETFRKWREERRADFVEYGTEVRNLRKAKCRVCDRVLQKGEGVRYIELMSDFYRGSDRFVCVECEERTRPGGPP